MTDERLDDPVLLMVRAARPAAPAGNHAASSDQAQRVLDRALSPPPGTGRDRSYRHLGRWTGLAVPALGALTAIVVVVVVFGALGRSHRPPATHAGSSTPPTRSAGSLSASEYAFAVGGDVSTRTSDTQSSSGLVLFRANELLRQRCMAQRGFRYIPVATPATSDLPSVTGYPSTFYPQPVASAYPEATLLALRRRVGFAAGNGPADLNEQRLKTLTPARQRLWRNAFIGRNGCDGVAEAQLFGSRRAANLEQQVPTSIYNYLNSVVYTRGGALAPSERRTAAVAAAWSRCMRTATGHTWPDENAILSGLGEDYSGPYARSLAIADTKCAYRTGQARTFAAVFRSGANHLPAKTATELRFLLAHRRAWIAKANSILKK